ncbi:hypothetical protein FRC08_002797 [Ceratobasidium sp. 394]|nr:hypothetical protein FRC08_002797 [Ceratobasidium sp. 394]
MSLTPLSVTTASDGRMFTNFGVDSPEAPWPFHRLAGAELTNELEKFADAKTSTASGVRVDSVWFQPAQGEDNCSQDRIYEGACQVSEQRWSLVGVFDGHAGEECSDYTVKHFPKYLEQALSTSTSVDMVSKISDAFVSFDNRIINQVRSSFPGPAALASMPAEELSAIINDQEAGGANYEKVILAMRGTTALVSLLDSDRKNMWVAGLGDCRAILGVQLPDGRWEACDLIAPHNGGNAVEMQKVADDHPGEPEVTLRNRVLGAIAVTRAFGDAEFKLPAEYTWQVFLRANPGFRVHSSVEDFTKRNLTPPYLSAVPDVVHIHLETNATSSGVPRFLILTSDGAVDEHVLKLLGRTEAESFQNWVELVGARLDEQAGDNNKPNTQENNLALDVLREAFGGPNEELLSIFLTIGMESKWIDDTSIQVVVF